MRRLGKTIILSSTIGMFLLIGSSASIPMAIAKDSASNLQDAKHSQNNQRRYQAVVNRLQQTTNLESATIGQTIQAVAKQFLGADYQAGLLDQSAHESLVISLEKFDCLLLMEIVIAIARNLYQQEPSYQGFTRKVENQRYWSGKMNGYCSRLHYFSDWIADNQRRGNITNITAQLGGISIPKKLNFMTTHRDSYPNLQKSAANFECIARVEAAIPQNFTYIPTANISSVYNQLQPGDLIGIATQIPGLDFTHTGLAYSKPDGSMGLLHASPAGSVVIAPDLQNYVSKVDQAIGIVVARSNQPSTP